MINYMCFCIYPEHSLLTLSRQKLTTVNTQSDTEKTVSPDVIAKNIQSNSSHLNFKSSAEDIGHLLLASKSYLSELKKISNKMCTIQ